MIDKDNEWLESTRKELVQSIEDIDDATLLELVRIRRQALAQKATKRVFAYILPAAVLATACLVLALIIYVPRQQQLPNQKEMINDLDLITTSESLELYEDLEFYEWLDAYDLQS